MLQLCAGSWDSLLMVHNYESIIIFSLLIMRKHTLGAIPLVNDEFRGQQPHFPVVTNVSCTGSELHLSDCTYSNNVGDCDSAAVICQGRSTSFQFFSVHKTAHDLLNSVLHRSFHYFI